MERAFNILALPSCAPAAMRYCCDALLVEPSSPVLFPFSGFGLILVSGIPMKDRFLARRIISFIPERKNIRFKLSRRKLTYYLDGAVY